MNRRHFLKLSGLGIGSVFAGSFLSTCNWDRISTLVSEGDTKQQLVRYIEESDRGYYENYKDIYRQKRVLLIINDYEFIEDEESKRKWKADYLIRFHLFGMVKCNFDIYKFKNTVTRVQKIRGNRFNLWTDVAGQRIYFSYYPSGEELIYPIRLTDSVGNGIILDKQYALPCVMTKQAFLSYLKDEKSKSYFKL